MTGRYTCFRRYDGSDGNLVPGTQLIHEWVHHLRLNGWSIADASRGKPSFPAQHAALSAMQASLASNAHSTITYGTNVLGELAYRRTASQVLSAEYQVDIVEDCVAYTPGGQLGLYITFKLLADACPDGMFISTLPGYLNYAELIGLVTNTEDRSRILPIHLRKEEQFKFQPAALRKLLAENERPIAALILCNPLNPTGQVLTKDEWGELAAIVKGYDFPIVLDEAFAEVIFDTHNRYSLFHADPSLLDRTFLFRSGTKAIGLSGERLSVTVVPAAFVERFVYLQSRILANAPISGQAGMAKALEVTDLAAKQVISSYYQNNADTLMTALEAMLGSSCVTPPQGGFYLLADFSCLLGTPLSAEAKAHLGVERETIEDDVDIVASLLFGHHTSDKNGVALIPGSFFGLDGKAGIVRISFSIGQDELLALCQQLARMLQAC